MVGRVGVLLIAALALTAAGWSAVRAGGSAAPSADVPVMVGTQRLAAAELDSAAARLVAGRTRWLPAARRAAAARAIERLWLRGEAGARGLRPAAEIGALRAQVADALVGRGRVPNAAGLAATFDAFHQRWRARTRCLPAYREPSADRCGGTPAAETCRWMGEATVCRQRGGWLAVFQARPARAARARLPRRLASALAGARRGGLRVRSRADALTLAHAMYVVARAARRRAAAQRVPHLSAPTLDAATEACRRQLRDSEPYLFGFGMQDAAGQAEGLIDVRTALARRLRASAADAVDGRKLRPLIAAIAAGNGELRRLASTGVAGDLAAVAERAARLDARTEPERAISRRLGLGECLARPAG